MDSSSPFKDVPDSRNGADLSGHAENHPHSSPPNSLSARTLQTLARKTSSSVLKRSSPPVDLRAQLHKLKFELSAVKDEADRDRLRHEKAVRELEAKVKSEGKNTDVCTLKEYANCRN